VPSYSRVKSAWKTLELLKELNRQSVSSVSHLHRQTGLPKPTVVRLLETLVEAGYVTNDRRQGGYRITSLVQSLSCGFQGDAPVVEAGRPWAIEFTRRFQWPVAIAVLDLDAVTVRLSTIADSPISPFHATINMRLPLLTRGLGRAYIAFCSRSERNFILQILARSADAEDAGARDRAATLAMLARIRKLGFAERAMSVEPASSSTLAVPIKRGANVLATIGVTYFRSAMAAKQARERYVPALWDMAANIANSVTALERQSRRRTTHPRGLAEERERPAPG
jgi:IclR family transcriptional regulator, mhp operon transcriptional activator